ncbi:TlpA disulfide reductase family protein [Fluviicola sp.]|uniref:TlpA family protein disulfide reductase n=1 Tax=Fluviicola sp. TaxID=1917219 RepID=UPI0031E04D03
MKTKVLVTLLLLWATVSLAQQSKPLKIGDKVPDVVFKTMLNYKTKSGKLSDFNGKAIIIDMWFRECGSCIDAMPHLDSVQKTYKDDLQVLLVTWQSKAQIEEFWKKRLPVQGLKFVQVVEDTILKENLFPAKSFPHQIWIDKNGIVKSINNGRKANLSLIPKLINGENINLKIKEDEMDPYISKAIYPMAGINYEANKSKVLHYSYLSTYRPELSGPDGFGIKENGITRYKFLNNPYTLLYHIAYAGNGDMPYDKRNRIIRKDTNPLMYEYDSVNFSNAFCYDLIFKEKEGVSFSKLMIADLDRYLGFNSHEEVRKIKTLIIRPNGKGTAYRDKIKPNERAFTEYGKFKNGAQFILNDGFLSFVNRSAMSYARMPTVFEFPGESKINLAITWDDNNLVEMNRDLEKFNVEAIIEERETKVIVLEDPR